jgi:hypothetical protein
MFSGLMAGGSSDEIINGLSYLACFVSMTAMFTHMVLLLGKLTVNVHMFYHVKKNIYKDSSTQILINIHLRI